MICPYCRKDFDNAAYEAHISATFTPADLRTRPPAAEPCQPDTQFGREALAHDIAEVSAIIRNGERLRAGGC